MGHSIRRISKILKKLLLDNSYPIKLINKNLFNTSSTLKNGGMLGQISDREWLDSDAALSQHPITQVMQETKDNENMNDVGPTETGHLEEHGEEHIIYILTLSEEHDSKTYETF
ncbi:hypothetical protein WA026_022852 [Henosepilachna vigintioctopunctata]|uniref:Uncharacterized protein n=1 Tax=Henosepilachna vigintioctopunctata TaxID=420089 RepID=A0AAW1UXE3_9CUCU